MAPADIAVRAALHRDISVLTGMARALAESFGEDPTRIDKDAIAGLLFGMDRWADALLAVDRDNRALGYVTFSRLFTPHDGARSLWIGDLYVMASARGLGVAGALMRAVAKRARAQNCHALVCPVDTGNKQGQGFYGRIGLALDPSRAVWRGGRKVIDDLASGNGT
ncbi:GNAT family N-acetyltransferase [Marivibrio halodurans]|uniref:GNAT family N-acetyltransferase n=1 Tax=Marivibrio halodurans TaxID=2039722 RepID=A0A8J7SLA3_9PROT|nr:GNAT family N-acetyltransferase [Marivibrio halodurans]MBP5856086.1 GNAT family N-acetyltransferase [Marivibrio halodurans]